MNLTCGLVGVPTCGKTTIFNAITAAGVASFDGAELHSCVIDVPDPRLESLASIYKPARIVHASMEVVDIPGLQAGTAEKPGRSSRLLQHIKDADVILHVVRCFAPEGSTGGDGIDPVRDVETIDIEMMVADSQTLQNKIQRLAKKTRSGDKDAVKAVEDCEKIRVALEQGVPARRQALDGRQLDSVQECNLVSLKPVLYIANVSGKPIDEYVKKLETLAAADGSEVVVVSGRDEAEISQLPPEDRQEFLVGLGIGQSSMTRLLRAAYSKLALVNFFTVGEDEVRAWTCRKGDLAPVAAGKIHSDMEKGFIRMEVMSCEDLLSLGSEAAVVKAGRQRIEGRTYEVREGDIVVVRFNKP
jgi:ribosome-binding ATPase